MCVCARARACVRACVCVCVCVSNCCYLKGAFTFFRPVSFHDKLLTVLVPAQYELSESWRGCQLVCEDGINFLCSHCLHLILLG